MIDRIEFRAVAPKVALPGLDEVHKKLLAISSALDAMNGKLAGLSTHSAFKRTKAEMADLVKSQLTKSLPVRSVAKVLGVPDIKDFESFVSRWKATHADLAKSFLKSENVGGSRVAAFTSPAKAASLAQKYFTEAMKRQMEPIEALRRAFGGGGGGGGTGPAPAPMAAAATAAAATAAATTAAATTAATSKAAAKAFTPGGASGPQLEERTTTTAKNMLVQRRELLGMGRTVDKFFKEVNGALEPIKEMETNSRLKARQGRLAEQVAKERALLEADAAIPGNRRDPAKMARLMGRQAAMLDSFVSGQAGTELEKMGQAALVARTRAAASKYRQRGGALMDESIEARQAELVSDFKRTAKIRKEMDAARRRGDKAEEERLSVERGALEERIAGNNKVLGARQKSEVRNQRSAEKVAEFDRKQSQAAAYRSGTYLGADYAYADFLASGGREVRRTESKRPGGPRSLTAEREAGGMKEILTVNYGKAGAEILHTTKAMTAARAEAGYLAGDFVKNTAKVALWAASVGVLYKSLALATHSMSEMIAVGAQVQRLDQIFRGVGGTTEELTNNVLQLAAANGRSGQEAMESAIQWSRLGLTKSQVNEAVRVSLMAANVADMTAAESTTQLQAIMQNYSLSVGQLGSVLGELNQISNTYNVTNAAMLEGIARSGAIAKQAGIPLAELMGLLGATIGKTAQSGANIGNMIKSVTLSLSNPAMQKELRQGFGFEVTGGGAEIKSMSTVLAELFIKYQELNDAQRQNLLFTVSGKTQSSRLAAMLDSYVKSQTLAVNAQLNLNSAEVENLKIKSALKAQLTGLATEWERFVVIQGSNGPEQALNGIAKALRNVLTLMNTTGGSWATTGLLGIMTAASMKVALTGMTMKAGAGQPGFLGRTGQRVAGAMKGLNTYVMEAAEQFAGNSDRRVGLLGARTPRGVRSGILGLAYKGEDWSKFARESESANKGLRALAGAGGMAAKGIAMATVALAEFGLPILAIVGAIYAFNAGMEAIGLSSEKATARMAGFNAEAEKASAAAGAALEAAKLFQTVERALPTMRNNADRENLLSQAAEATHGDIADPSERAKAVAQTKEEWLLLSKQSEVYGGLNRYAESNKALEAERAKELQRNFNQLQKEYEARDKDIKRNAQELDRLKKAQQGAFKWINPGTRQKNIDELEARKSEKESQQIRNRLEATNLESLEERLKYDTKIATALEVQRMSLEAIGDIYRNIGTSNPFEKSLVQIAGVDAQLRAIDLRMVALQKGDEKDFAGKAVREKEMARLKKEEEDQRGKLEEANETLAAPHAPAYDMTIWAAMARGKREIAQSDKDRLEADLKRNLEDQKQVDAGFLPGLAPDDSERRRLEKRKIIAEREKLEAERSALQGNMPLIQAQTSMQFGREEARRETSPFEVGRDETQKLQNKRQGIENRIAEIEHNPNRGIKELAEHMELLTQRAEVYKALRDRTATVERDIKQLAIEQNKEFEHSLLGAGPGELLRKLAAMRMAGAQMTNGSFMSLSPGMRQDVAQLDPRFDPRMMDLQREKQRQARQPGSEFDAGQAEISRQIGGLAGQLKQYLPDISTYEAATASVNKLGDAASRAADAANGAADRLNALLANGTGSKVSPPEPRNPQSGGVGGGQGRTAEPSARAFGPTPYMTE